MTPEPVDLAVPGVRGLAPYEPGKPIETLAREYGLTDIIKLASNENPRGPSPKAVAAAREAVGTVHRYPDGAGTRLRERLSTELGLEPAGITLGNGSNDVLDMIARCFLDAGTNAVFSRHAFAVYPIATRAAGASCQVADARPSDDVDAPYGHDLAAMLAAVNADTRVVFVANPNNPTGTWVDHESLHRFLLALPDHVIAVVDEAYAECVVEQPGYPDATTWLADMPRLIVTRTFSKIYGLSGLRCGYALSSPEIADLLNRVRHPFNVNSVALAAAEAALDDTGFLADSRANNHAGLQQLTTGFQGLGLAVIPSVANFVAVDVGRNAAPVYEALLHEGVIVRPIGGYEMPNHLRVTVGLPEENQRCIDALGRVLGEST